MSMYRPRRGETDIHELMDQFFWLLMERAETKDIDGATYFSFEEVCDLMDVLCKDVEVEKE